MSRRKKRRITKLSADELCLHRDPYRLEVAKLYQSVCVDVLPSVAGFLQRPSPTAALRKLLSMTPHSAAQRHLTRQLTRTTVKELRRLCSHPFVNLGKSPARLTKKVALDLVVCRFFEIPSMLERRTSEAQNLAKCDFGEFRHVGFFRRRIIAVPSEIIGEILSYVPCVSDFMLPIAAVCKALYVLIFSSWRNWIRLSVTGRFPYRNEPPLLVRTGCQMIRMVGSDSLSVSVRGRACKKKKSLRKAEIDRLNGVFSICGDSLIELNLEEISVVLARNVLLSLCESASSITFPRLRRLYLPKDSFRPDQSAASVRLKGICPGLQVISNPFTLLIMDGCSPTEIRLSVSGSVGASRLAQAMRRRPLHFPRSVRSFRVVLDLPEDDHSTVLSQNVFNNLFSLQSPPVQVSFRICCSCMGSESRPWLKSLHPSICSSLRVLRLSQVGSSFGSRIPLCRILVPPGYPGLEELCLEGFLVSQSLLGREVVCPRLKSFSWSWLGSGVRKRDMSVSSLLSHVVARNVDVLRLRTDRLSLWLFPKERGSSGVGRLRLEGEGCWSGTELGIVEECLDECPVATIALRLSLHHSVSEEYRSKARTVLDDVVPWNSVTEEVVCDRFYVRKRKVA